MPTKEEQLRNYYAAAKGTNYAQDKLASGVGASGRRYPGPSHDGSVSANGVYRDWVEKVGSGGAGSQPARPSGSGQPDSGTAAPGFGGSTQPPTDSSTGGSGTIDSSGVSDSGSTGTDTGAGTGTGTGENVTPVKRTLMELYEDYLNQLGGGYTTPSAKDQSDFVREMYEANLAANKSQLESDYNQNLSDLESEASKIGSTYYEQQRQAQAESDRNRQSFQEYANAQGLNSGTGGQAELARQNQLSANLNTLRQSEAEKRAEVERQRVLLGQQYQNAIQKAQADNDLAKAKALYEEAVRVDESLAAAAKADADRALQIFGILNNTALSAASAYASQDNPDLSLYGKLLGLSGLGGTSGILNSSTDELQNMYNKAQQIKSSGGYYVSSSSGGTTFKKATSSEIEQAEYYINLIKLAGSVDRVKEYILGHYKELTSDTGGKIGYQERFQIGDAYQERAGGYSDKIYTIGTDLGKNIADSLAPGKPYVNTKDGSVWERSAINGKLYVTKDGVKMEASYQEGYKG